MLYKILKQFLIFILVIIGNVFVYFFATDKYILIQVIMFIAAIGLGISKKKNEHTDLFYKIVKMNFILVLIVLISFGVCFLVLMGAAATTKFN